MSTPRSIGSVLGWSTTREIFVRGRSLPNEILGNMSLGEFTFFELTGASPTPHQGVVFDALLIALVEHGLTPSALAARLTYAGAPESLQAAVAAGLAGLGTVFVWTTEGAARMLTEALSGRAEGQPLDEVARAAVENQLAGGRQIPGLGHPIHKPVDPRAVRLFEIAEQNGLAGDHVALMKLIGVEAERTTGKTLPVNVTGAIGAISCELGFPWRIVRGFAVIARAIGLVAHISEEIERPLALEVWRRAEAEADANRGAAVDS